MVQSRSNLLEISDLYRMPDDEFRHELVQGQLVSEPPPGGRHGRVAARFVSVLDGVARRTGYIVLTCDAGFILHRSPDTVRAPDVALVNRERYLALEDERKLIPGAPDLAVEVLSPGNTRAEIHAKTADYLSAGTALVWVADPESQSIQSYRELLAPRFMTGTDVLTADAVLPGFSVPVQAFFEL